MITARTAIVLSVASFVVGGIVVAGACRTKVDNKTDTTADALVVINQRLANQDKAIASVLQSLQRADAIAQQHNQILVSLTTPPATNRVAKKKSWF